MKLKQIDLALYRKFAVPVNDFKVCFETQIVEHNKEDNYYTVYVPNSELPERFIVWDFKFMLIKDLNYVFIGNFDYRNAIRCYSYKENQAKHIVCSQYPGVYELWIPFIDYVEHLLKHNFVIEGINHPFVFTKFKSRERDSFSFDRK